MSAKAVRFDSKIHYEEICSWAKLHGMKVPPLSILPEMGRIVPGKAALFLYRTDSKLGFIESLISNPINDGKDLSDAIDECVKMTERDAKDEGIEFLCSSTFIPGVAARAKEHGFDVRPERYRLLTKRLI